MYCHHSIILSLNNSASNREQLQTSVNAQDRVTSPCWRHHHMTMAELRISVHYMIGHGDVINTNLQQAWKIKYTL